MDKEKITELSKLFKAYDSERNINVPVVLSKGQQDIFSCILQRKPQRVHVMTPTQYGKSFTVALAVLLRAVTFPEKWAIVAPSEPKCQIIMKYIIEQATTNELFSPQLDITDSIDRLRRERSKRRINFKGGGEIYVLSADSRNKISAGESLMGFGSPNIILDESSLIDDDIYAKIKRMLGAHKANFLLEIGNPFNRNHFLRSFRSDDYKLIHIDWKQAIEEERFTREFIDEMRKEAFFDILYEVKFPPEDSVDARGWSRLVTETEITNSFRSDEPNAFGEVRLGVDIAAGGGNFNVWVLRTGNFAKVLAKTNQENLMEVIGTTITLAEEYGVLDNKIFIDATGVGAGVKDRFHEMNWDVQGINMAESAMLSEKYINRRAENFFRMRDWFKKGGMLEKNNDFYQISELKYKLRDTGKLKIISKEELAREGVASPDVADAIMLTFSETDEEINLLNKIKRSRLSKRGKKTYE